MKKTLKKICEEFQAALDKQSFFTSQTCVPTDDLRRALKTLRGKAKL